MEDVFYSLNGQHLFQVIGYSTSFTHIQEKVKEFCETFGIKEKDVNLDLVQDSRRYKQMFFIYTQTKFSWESNKEVFQLGENWTMYKWLRN